MYTVKLCDLSGIIHPYKLGLITGRFQVLHKGHADMISKALSICERVILFIGSSQESRTKSNPLTFEERKELITEVFEPQVEKGRLIILPLPDAGLGDNEKWGDYVLSNIPAEYGTPDIAISGRESRRATWFDNHNIAELFTAKTVDVSATEMRKRLIDDDVQFWQEYTPLFIRHRYDELRNIILEVNGEA